MYDDGSRNNTSNHNNNKISKAQGLSSISILPRMIPLVIKIGFVYLRYKRKAKKAGKVFKKELLASGMDKNMADRLTDDYLSSAHIFRGFDFSDLTKEATN